MSSSLTTNVDKRRLQSTKFPEEFNAKFDMRRVHNDFITVIKVWIQGELAKILKDDDEVVTDLICNTLEGSNFPNIKELQISLIGFLGDDTQTFCRDLWRLCLSAQENPAGIPQQMIDAKRNELTQKKIDEDRAREEAEIRRERAEREREVDLARIRDRERNRRDRGRGGRDSRDSTRSPPRRRQDRNGSGRGTRKADIYIPSDYSRRRGRSASHERSPSRSRTPPPRRRQRQRSYSRSPPRRRRVSSKDRSLSRDRKDQWRPDRRRSRSPKASERGKERRSKRSPSPVNGRRRAFRSRSPPSKRTRRDSPSPRRPTSGATMPAQQKQSKKPAGLASNDLMAKSLTKDGAADPLRLSRESSTPALSTTETPATDKDNPESSAQSNSPEEVGIDPADPSHV